VTAPSAGSAGLPVAVVHADESCLGNGREGSNPGGAGALIEVRSRGRVERRDLYISAPATTNNRMALAGAIAVFALLSRKGKRLRVVYVSDSEYLIKGMREWVPGWERRAWRRKGGEILNPELWQTLVRVSASHQPTWMWVRGHAGNPKNEYANDLAMRAAGDQLMSEGAVPSGFGEWLEAKRARGQYADYDPDAEFAELADQREA
jgi:ribonuclease HI